ncbi:hypothetical protein [Geoalkalibacter sp.]|uniref:hypothetical protein n=1 Tax=Geoalkalibacter sp. TaxID=3041440 RepID=UPI00272EAE0C|nr:hypothetical protein [Geoalkalibacter sp.]
MEPCQRDKDFEQIRLAMTDMVTELRKVMSELRETLLEDREHRMRIEHLEKGQDVLFKRSREHGDELRELCSWQDRVDGGLKVIVAIPVICSLISTLAALYAAFGRMP